MGGLRLHLGLKCGETGVDCTQPPSQSFSLSLDQPASMAMQQPLESHFSNAIQTSNERANETIACYKGFDLNQQITTEDDNLVVLPANNVALNNGGIDEGSSQPKKKMKLSTEQVAFLEKYFHEHNTPDKMQRSYLAEELNVTPKQVGMWFHNFRRRTRFKKNEIDVEEFKTCCETLKEQNEMLKKEMDGLRALNENKMKEKEIDGESLKILCETLKEEKDNVKMEMDALRDLNENKITEKEIYVERLKIYCEALHEENNKLKKEMDGLRALNKNMIKENEIYVEHLMIYCERLNEENDKLKKEMDGLRALNKNKMKEKEIDVERLKICCETLKEERDKFKKDFDGLRARNLSYRSDFNPTPTFFYECISCENVRISPPNCVIKQEQDIGTTSNSKRN